MVKALELKKEFKETVVGVIPADWDYDEIQNVADITTGDKNTQDRVSDGAYPFFVRSQIVERINSYSFDGEAILTAGDGVGTGKVFHYINGKFDFHQRVYKISKFSNRLGGYFFYLYFSKNFYNRMMQMTAKSSVDSVRREMIAKMLIPLPPKAEQTAIAATLNDTEALINHLEKFISKKKAVRQAVVYELLRPKRGWEVKKLGEIADVVGGGTPSTFNSNYWNGEINWFTPTEIGDKKYSFFSARKITQEGFKSCSSKLLPVGTILLTSRANIGDVSILMKEACTNQGFQSLIVRKGYHNEFLYYLIMILKPVLVQNSSGSTFLEISPSKLKSIEVSIPDYETQVHTAKTLSCMDEEIEILEKRLKKQQMLKQAMMQNLLTGKIRLL